MTRQSKFAIASVVGAALSVAVTALSADAQMMGGGRHHQQKTKSANAQKPKVDEKAYNAALKTLPDKPFDPWHQVR